MYPLYYFDDRDTLSWKGLILPALSIWLLVLYLSICKTLRVPKTTAVSVDLADNLRFSSCLYRRHWYRRRGCRGCKRTPKTFDLVKIRANSLKSGQNLCKFGQNVWKPFRKITVCALILQNWHLKLKCRRFFKVVFLFRYFLASYGKFGQKWYLKCFDLRKSTQHEMKCSRLVFLLSFFRVRLGKFGQKSFPPPKICLLLHLWQRRCQEHIVRIHGSVVLQPNWLSKNRPWTHGKFDFMSTVTKCQTNVTMNTKTEAIGFETKSFQSPIKWINLIDFYIKS